MVDYNFIALYQNSVSQSPIIWYYYGSLTDGTKYRIGYREEDNSSLTIYEEINQ